MTSLRFNDKKHSSFVMRRQTQSFVIVLNAKRYEAVPRSESQLPARDAMTA
jgi:hypothetical protein